MCDGAAEKVKGLTQRIQRKATEFYREEMRTVFSVELCGLWGESFLPAVFDRA
jgi:hypothetical protein